MNRQYLLKANNQSIEYLHRQAGLLRAEGRNASVASVLRALILLYETETDIRDRVRQMTPKKL